MHAYSLQTNELHLDIWLHIHSIHIITLRLISKLRECSFDLNIEKTISSTNMYKLAQRSK